MNDIVKPDDPLKFLVKITKVLPRLATSNEHEKIATLTAIERLLTSAGLDWNDVTTAITDFLTNVALVKDEPEAKPDVKPAPGFSSTAGTTHGPGGPHRTSRTSPPPPPPRQPAGPPPPPPPRTWQQKAAGTSAEQETVIDELLRRQLWQSPSEKRTMSRIQGVLMAGLPLDMVMRSELIKFAARI